MIPRSWSECDILCVTCHEKASVQVGLYQKWARKVRYCPFCGDELKAPTDEYVEVPS